MPRDFSRYAKPLHCNRAQPNPGLQRASHELGFSRDCYPQAKRKPPLIEAMDCCQTTSIGFTDAKHWGNTGVSL